MGKYQKMLNKAELQVRKAENLLEAMQYKKAGNTFLSAGNTFLKFKEHNLAEESFYKAARSFAKGEKIPLILESLRNAGITCLLTYKFSDALDYYKKAIEYVSFLKNGRDKDNKYILYSTLAYFCHFAKGQKEQGLNLIKKVKKKIDRKLFKENSYIRLIKNLIIATRDLNENYIDYIENDFVEYEFRQPEEKILKEIMVAAKSQLLITTRLKLDKEEYITNDLLELSLNFNTENLIELSKQSFYEYRIKKLSIIKIDLVISDNLAAHEKPILPIEIEPNQIINIDYVIKPHFQKDDTFIGPIVFTVEMDGRFIFFVKTSEIKIKLISPPAILDISTKNLRPPLIGQSFPFQILIHNNGHGEAHEIDISVKFPKEFKIMRGTIKKQIYSLRLNEKIEWELSLKPLKAGDYSIEMDIKFKDSDGKFSEDIKIFPFSIKM